MKSKAVLALIAVLVVSLVLGAAGVGALIVTGVPARVEARVGQAAQTLLASNPAVAYAAPRAAATAAPVPQTIINIPAGADQESALYEAVYQKVNPSVVMVSTLATARSFGRGQSQGQAIPQGEGSGFVWDAQGHIVTNDHVVSGADQIQVTFSDGTTVSAKVVGTDPNGDVAVIQVDPSLVNLVPVEQGNIADVKAGQQVVAIGNPFGFSGTMTQGIVSALGRTIPSVTGFSIPEAIQTDAAINPGNSGGPLLNLQGQVIGINDQIQTNSGSSSGVGFAIPINLVQRIVPSLIKTGSYGHSYLGIEGGTYSRAWAQALGFPADAQGAYVEGVVSGGPAAQAGLRAGTQNTNIVLGPNTNGTPAYLQSGGDLITAIDGHAITKMDDLLIYLEENTSPGQAVKLTVLRANGQQATISVTLGTRPDQAPSTGLP